MASIFKSLVRVSGWLFVLFLGLALAAILLVGQHMRDGLLAFEVSGSQNIDIYVADPNYGLGVNVTNNLVDNTEPVWSSDGRLTYVSGTNSDRAVYTLTLDQLHPVNVSNTSDSHSPAWSPGGRLAYVTEHYPYANSIDVLNPDGRIQSYTVDGFPNLISMESPSWLTDHELVFIGGLYQEQKQVFLLNLDDDTLQNISNEPSLYHAEAVGSPRGDSVAFISDFLNLAVMEETVSVWEKASGEVSRITQNTAHNGSLSWSNDGKLTFSSDMNGNLEVYQWDAQTNTLENLTNNEAADDASSWASSGNLAFVSNRSGEDGIYRMNPFTLGVDTIVIRQGSRSPVWSN